MLSSMQCWRVSLAIFSSIIWFFSMSFFYGQVVNNSDSDTVELLFNNTYYYVSFCLVLFCSIAVSIAGVTGCWGALDAKIVVLQAYLALLSTVTFLEILAAVFIAVWNSTMRNDIAYRISNTVKEYELADPAFTKALETTQSYLRCCGANSYLDWINSSWWINQRDLNTSLVVPQSCCINDVIECNFGSPPFEDVFYRKQIWTEGCINDTTSLARYHRNKLVVAVTSFGILYSGGVIATIYVVYLMR